MDQGTSEDHRLLNWLQAYTHYICDRLNFPHEQGTSLLEDFLRLPARISRQESFTPPYEQPEDHTGTTNSHCDTRHEHDLTNPGLATHIQDQAIFPRESCDLDGDANTGYDTANSMAIESSSSPARLQSYPENQRSCGMMPVDQGYSESSGQLLQPIEAVEDRAPIGSIKDYDPLWVQKGNVSSDIVEGFSRKNIHFDVLFSSSVIRPGDVLTVQVLIPKNGSGMETEAHLTVRPKSSSDEQYTC